MPLAPLSKGLHKFTRPDPRAPALDHPLLRLPQSTMDACLSFAQYTDDGHPCDVGIGALEERSHLTPSQVLGARRLSPGARNVSLVQSPPDIHTCSTRSAAHS